ncbi:murein transglycosylase A [Novosphingobium sp. ES2-1]|uniref:murein transglycosylase A n=1 Tax=Novosphingobium sp. ES2-1 TaxID=2780074 RepID=UPI001E2D2E08|nr:murein transglycosylase A [Novosphingobium sp. ES2-1]
MRGIQGFCKTKSAAIIAALFLLGGCVRLVPEGSAPRPVTPPTPPAVKPATAALTGVVRGPVVAGLGFKRDNTAAALQAFATSCPRLTKRTDNSGLTRPEDWAPACAAAATWPAGEAARFFATYFETAEVGDGAAFVTGYFEPEIAGSRTRQPGFDVPVYALPKDLVRAKPGDAQPLPDGKMPLGRYDDAGVFTAYHDRGQIEDGALQGKGLELAWAADPVEFFFLQIQGSGRLRAPDGSVIRLGFAGQNGHAYTGIGSLMRERGLIGSSPGQYSGSMQGIQQYLRDFPDAGRQLMRQNRSYVFFRELTGPGPVGALNVPIAGRSTVAADPAFVPLGAPVWLQVDRKEASGLWVAQDTGGAIQGANRFDSFWGAGPEARQIAGGMSARGRALILLPKGTLARLGQQ